MKKDFLNYIKTFAILILLFMVTVYIRFAYISFNVPSTNQGHLVLLTSLDNLFERGLAACYYSPIQTWHNKGDKLITYYKRLEDSKGENFYVSHPPFAFLFTYAVFKILDIYPNQVSLQIIGLILHLIGAVFIYLIVLIYFNKKGVVLFFPAIISYITYLFFPVLMNLHLFSVFSETFVQPIWIISIYYILRMFKSSKKISLLKYIILGLLIFLMIYTEWLGIFFAFSVCVVSIYYREREDKYIKILLTTVVSCILAISLIIVQYSQIDGFYALMRIMKIRFIEHSGFFGDYYSEQHLGIFNPQSYLLLLKQINNLLGGFGYLFLGMFLVVVFMQLKHKNYSFRLTREAKNLFILSVVPPLLYFIVFFNISIIHYIYVAKFGVPISLFISVLYKKLILSFSLKKTKLLVILFAIIKVIVVIISVYIFIIQAPKDNNNLYLADVSEIIQANSYEDEAIFINIKTKAYNPLPSISYEAKRNLMYADNLYHAEKLLASKNKTKGVFYIFDQKKNFYSIKHFVLKPTYDNKNKKFLIDTL